MLSCNSTFEVRSICEKSAMSHGGVWCFVGSLCFCLSHPRIEHIEKFRTTIHSGLSMRSHGKEHSNSSLLGAKNYFPFHHVAYLGDNPAIFIVCVNSANMIFLHNVSSFLSISCKTCKQ